MSNMYDQSSALTFVMASKRKTLCVDQNVTLIRAIEKGKKLVIISRSIKKKRKIHRVLCLKSRHF